MLADLKSVKLLDMLQIGGYYRLTIIYTFSFLLCDKGSGLECITRWRHNPVSKKKSESENSMPSNLELLSKQPVLKNIFVAHDIILCVSHGTITCR
jgi:hypothetical protein